MPRVALRGCILRIRFSSLFRARQQPALEGRLRIARQRLLDLAHSDVAAKKIEILAN